MYPHPQLGQVSVMSCPPNCPDWYTLPSYTAPTNRYGETPAEAFARLAREREIRETAQGITGAEAIKQLAAEERVRSRPTVTATLAPISTQAKPGILTYLIPAALLYAAVAS